MGTTAQEKRRHAPAAAYVGAAVVAVAFAAAVGLGAASLRHEDFWLVAGVFAATTLPVGYAAGWALLVSRHVVEEDEHAQESVERHWWDRAASGTLTDLVAAAGIGLAALSVTGLDLPGTLALGAVLVLAFVDLAVRYAMLRRGD